MANRPASIRSVLLAGTRTLVHEDGTLYAATPSGDLLWQMPMRTMYLKALRAGLCSTEDTHARIL